MRLAALQVPAGASGLTGTGSNALQICGLFASYCCYGKDNEPVDTNMPEGMWPPASFPIPAEILADSSPSQATAPGPSQTSSTNPKTPPPILCYAPSICIL